MYALRRWSTIPLRPYRNNLPLGLIKFSESVCTEDQNWDRNKRRVHTSLLNQAVQHHFSCFTLSHLTLPLFQSTALPSPLLLSTALSPIFYPPLPPFFCFQTGNVRWANAIHCLTKGKLGLLLQGSDRLMPEARFFFSLNPLTCWSVCGFFFLIYTQTHTIYTKLNHAWGRLCSLWR